MNTIIRETLEHLDDYKSVMALYPEVRPDMEDLAESSIPGMILAYMSKGFTHPDEISGNISVSSPYSEEFVRFVFDAFEGSDPACALWMKISDEEYRPHHLVPKFDTMGFEIAPPFGTAVSIN